ncbi:hypothetical protein AGMMS49543_17970 [Betaproteobacteria bacterium]|nr:hypothetical protein AGMMS49543_17970 [Betaproteobacteria bacterium]GHU15757.1 hypothetical protein AGMMS50243_00080 [Betaproteobacteria bacterium]
MELEIYQGFRGAGVSEEKAQAIAQDIATFINKAIDQRYAMHSRQRATQGDVEKARAETEKARMEVARIEASIIKWNVGAIIAAAGLALAMAKLFFTN